MEGEISGPEWGPDGSCSRCLGTGKWFFCDSCDTEQPGECLHLVEQEANA